ncbi:DUF2339 domain-containing protein [Paenibacillus sp. CC-CFT747]|nr:DUF2339 domain-containing protein [Paenibacillus sp. CC-CFT747]
MNDLVKRHWTSFLGALLIVCAFVYLFKYTVDQGWITQQMKIGIGLLVGAGLAVGGIRLILSGRRTIGEITSGMGAAVLYTTVSFSGIYFALWDSMIVLLCMTAITVGLSLLAYRENLRILMNLALIGALVSPLVLRPENDQVFTLFVYLLVINIVYFVLSLRKSWTELRVVAFAGTWILYMVYFFHFDPVVTEVWSLPYRYATAAFLFYVLGLVISSWKNNLTFEGLNLYLNVANAVLFGLWSVILLDGLTSVAYPMAFTGVLYLALSYGVYRLMESRTGTPVLTFFLGGVFLLMLAASQAGKGLDIKPLISVYLWTIVAGFLLLAGQARKIDGLKAISLFVWFVVVLYWFVATWSTPRGIWFGVYLPFLNWGPYPGWCWRPSASTMRPRLSSKP